MHPDIAGALLAPKSIALIGASDDASKTHGRPLKYLREAGFAGRLYPVNPRRTHVLGEQAWANLSDLPEVPEHAFILTGTEAAIEAAEACAARGVKVATILASGFAEAGAIGAGRVKRLQACARGSGMRILGPSSLGLVNLADNLILTANAAFAEGGAPRGSVFVASHSGSMIGALLSRSKARGFGYAGLVSVGNEIDLTLGEICQATLSDDRISSYMLFLESLAHADDLRAFAEAAHARGKPVLAYKLGRSMEAAELATSHTGALAGDDDIADAFLRACGICRVESLDGFIEAMPLLQRVPPAAQARRPRVGVATTTGGGAAMAVDQLGLRGISVVPPPPALTEHLQAAGISFEPARIIDLTLAGTRPDVMKAVLGGMATSGAFDLVLAVVGSSARNHPELAVAPILEIAHEHRAIAVFLVPDAPRALEMLAKANVPAFRSPESCADAIAAVFRCERPRLGGPRPELGPSHPVTEEEAYHLLDRLGIARAPTAVLSPSQAPATLPFPYPVAAKILSAEIAHKSDVGGVILDIRNDAALAEAAALIRKRVAAALPELEALPILVQPMTRGLGEALIGYRVDPQAGPVILVAAGGINTEIYKDRALRLAPVTLDEAREMIAEVKGFAPLRGFRGSKPGDLEALADAIVKLSRIGEVDPRVMELEVNPVLVRPQGQGIVAVDALARLAARS